MFFTKLYYGMSDEIIRHRKKYYRIALVLLFLGLWYHSLAFCLLAIATVHFNVLCRIASFHGYDTIEAIRARFLAHKETMSPANREGIEKSLDDIEIMMDNDISFFIGVFAFARLLVVIAFYVIVYFVMQTSLGLN